MRRKLTWIAVSALALAQFAQPDHGPAQSDPSVGLASMAQPPPEVAELLRIACYDCHSNNTRYPWYSHITPVNFWLQHHINEGREEFNLSDWGTKSATWRDHKKKDALRELKKGGMPLPSYTWMHHDADLSDAQRQALISFFASLKP